MSVEFFNIDPQANKPVEQFSMEAKPFFFIKNLQGESLKPVFDLLEAKKNRFPLFSLFRM